MNDTTQQCQGLISTYISYQSNYGMQPNIEHYADSV